MIRTKTVLIEKDNVITYRWKNPSGGFNIDVYDIDCNYIGTAHIDRKSSKPINIVKEVQSVPDDVFVNAVTLTKHLPYHIVPYVNTENTTDNSAFNSALTDHDVTILNESIIARFDDFINKFTDSSGAFLANKLNINLMQYISRNKIIAKIISENDCSVDDVLKAVIEIKAEELVKLTLPSDGYTKALLHMINERCNSDALSQTKKLIAIKFASKNRITSSK